MIVPDPNMFGIVLISKKLGVHGKIIKQTECL